MAKQGMKRPDVVKIHPKNEFPPVPQLQDTARPIVPGAGEPSQKVRHFDSDLARDDLLDDVPAQDRP